MSPQVNQLHDVMQQYLPWHKARVTFTAAFILSLITLTTVNFTKAFQCAEWTGQTGLQLSSYSTLLCTL